jgi:hypothetical protein
MNPDIMQRIQALIPYYSKNDLGRRLGYSDYCSLCAAKTLSMKAIWALDELEKEVSEKHLEPRRVYVYDV